MKNTKKAVPLLIALVLLFSIFIPAYASEAPLLTGDMRSELSGEIIIDGERIEAPAPYTHKDDAGVIMVPLRAIADSLGLKVIWEPEESKIILGYGMQLWIGDNEYVTNFSIRTRINPAPELVGGRTFVPLDFIRNALEHDVYVSDGVVVIGESTSSTIWITLDGNAIWFSEGAPYDHSIGSDTIQVGKSPDGSDVFALVRMTLRGDWLAEEVTGARLFLKVAEGTPPGEINGYESPAAD